MEAIERKDLITPFSEFEKKHRIEQTRDDIPRKYIGRSPSKYYKEVDMNVRKLSGKVKILLKRLYGKKS